MANWTLYSKKIKIDGDTERERSINYLVDGINDSFVNSPSYFEIYINDSETTTGVQIVSGSSTGGQSNSNIKTIIMQPDNILNTGDLIYWDSVYWLCMESEFFSNVYYRGKISKCTKTLQHYKNGILLEIPIVIESGIRLYSMGQDENKYVSAVDDEVIVYTPNNSDTQEIKVDQIYTIGRRNYKIKTIQDIILPGLLVLKMEATTSEPIIETHEYSVTILNGEEVLLSMVTSPTLQLEIQCKLDGVLVNNPEVTYESSEEDYVAVSETGLVTAIDAGLSTITVNYGTAIATIQVTSVIHASDVFDITVTPADTNMYVNNTKTFTAKVTNNGVEATGYVIVWSLVNVDGSNNTYCDYVVEGNDITITSKNLINKQIKIKATLLYDSDVYEERVITFRSLV